MRIHLGHHFYGAGNLGDDFMLAGFLSAMLSLAPEATFTCSVPFPLAPLRLRFPSIDWLPYDDPHRERAIAESDVWLGLGGSPFQSAQSRWFIDHLIADAAHCQRFGKPMFFLGVGVQTTTELDAPEVQHLCANSAGIWTRDATSAERLATLPSPPPVLTPAADLAHLFFRSVTPPPAAPGRITLVANFDYAGWPGQAACLQATRSISATTTASSSAPLDTERIWLAQESRELPGAERALYAALPPAEQVRWRLVIPDPLDAVSPSSAASAFPANAPLDTVLVRWPSGEWLITARFHAAFAGAWAGSKIVVIATNEKLRAAARDLGCPMIAPDADEPTVAAALRTAVPVPRATLLAAAESAHAACAAFVQSARVVVATHDRAAPRSAVAPGEPTA